MQNEESVYQKMAELPFDAPDPPPPFGTAHMQFHAKYGVCSSKNEKNG